MNWNLRYPLQVASLFWLSLASYPAQAAHYFVLPTEGKKISDIESKRTSDLIRSFILKHEEDSLVAQPNEADYILQPKILQTDEWEMLTIEKSQAGEVLVVSQVQIEKADGLRATAEEALISVLGASPPREKLGEKSENISNLDLANNKGLESAMTSSPPDLEDRAVGRTFERPPVSKSIYNYWTFGVGVFDAINLRSKHAHVAINGGHEWNISDHLGLAGMAEAVLPTGIDDAYLVDLTAGASYYFLPSLVGSPYVTGDIGYGYARTSALHQNGGGFAYGAGIGCQFHRSFIAGHSFGYDLQLHYASIANDLGAGLPSVYGVRLGINF